VAAREIIESRRQLEALLGRTVELFAYPYGHQDDAMQAFTAAAGYRAAFATVRGLNTPATPRYCLRRITVAGGDNLLLFGIKVWVGDDPLRPLPAIVSRPRPGSAGP